MSKRPTDVDEPPAKKRGGAYLSKDDVSDDEALVEEKGLFEAAAAEVLKNRRIIKIRRGTGAPPPTPTAGVPTSAGSNPFAGISLTATGSNGLATLSAAQGAAVSSKEDLQAAEDFGTGAIQAFTTSKAPHTEESTGLPLKEPSASEAANICQEAPAVASDSNPASATEGSKAVDAARPELGSSGNGKQGFAGFASSAAPFATFSSAGSGHTFTFGKSGNTADAIGTTALGSFPATSSIFGLSQPSSSPGAGIQGATGSGAGNPAVTLPPETKAVTGEEDETTLWGGEGTLYEFTDKAWKERGRGELKINRAPDRPARFVMRQRGGLSLLINANIRPDMRITPTDGKKGASFQVANFVKATETSEAQQSGLQTYAFRLKIPTLLDSLLSTVEQHKRITGAKPSEVTDAAEKAAEAS